jgi:phosphoribosylglycinamide formyltransferase-1
MMKKINLGVLVSGNGSNLQSIIDNIEKGLLNADIKVVISNNPAAYALERAKKHGIPSILIDKNVYKKREEFDNEMIKNLKSHAVDLVVMAGFMRILTSLFLSAFPMRVMNIHPSLLPSFSGINAQKRAVESGVKFSGCTIHFADEGVDTGPIIMQAIVPVYTDDTEDTLAERILKEEHRIYSQAIQFYAEGRMTVKDRKVYIEGVNRISATSLHNPPLVNFKTL